MAVRGMLGVNVSNEQWAQLEANVAKAAETPTTPTSTQPPVTPVNTQPSGIGIGTYTPPPSAFSATQMLDDLLYNAIGVQGLGAWAADLYNRGASPVEIIQSLRYGTDTSDAGKRAYETYLAAFPKMDVFIKNGTFSGQNPELQYIAYRNTVKEAASRYGVDSSLVTNDKMADYIANNNSAAEIVSRMGTAAAAVATTPPETLTTLRNYYGLQNGDLISFYLDPASTEAQLQQRYTAAQIGGEALRQNFGDITAATAENLANQGVNMQQAAQGFAVAASRQGFGQGYGELASREELVNASFGQADATRKIERIAKSRTAAFEGGGGFATNKTGMAGLGTAEI